MAGLFDLEALLGMFGSGANAVPALPTGAGLPTDEQRATGIEALTRGMGGPQPNLGPDLVNPNPVPLGGVPIPSPPPAVASVIASPGGPATNPAEPPVTLNRGIESPTTDEFGGAFTGNTGEVTPPPSLEARAPLPGAEGPVAPEEGSTDISARAKDKAIRGGLAEALKGVQGPKPPELQKIASPNAPRATGTIRGGDLMALLMALNAGGAGKLPTLGGR